MQALGQAAALEFFEHAVPLNAACDDDGRGNTKRLAGEVKLLVGFGALELVDRQRMAIDTAHTSGTRGQGGRHTAWAAGSELTQAA